MDAPGYRMVVSTEQDYVTTCAQTERQLYAWLDIKRYDASALDDGRNQLAENVTLDRDSTSGVQGSFMRWRMKEHVSEKLGTWQSTVTVRADHRDARPLTWVQVDIENRPSQDDRAPKRASTPRIARLLLESLRARDGLADVRAEPTFIEPEDVDEVIEELCDQERRLPIVVASVPYGKDPDEWAETVLETVFKHLAGLAVMYILLPEAQGTFNQALEFHPVFGGGMRTYLPGIDPAWKPDAQRHPVMSRRYIEASPHRAAATLAALPQQLALRSTLPTALRTLPLQRTRPRPATHGSEVERLRDENEALSALLDDAEQTEAAQAKEADRLKADLDKAERSVDDARGENEELYEQLQKARHQARYLQQQLSKAGQGAIAYATDGMQPGIDYPETFADLLDRFSELPHLRFTGNRKITCDLDSQSVTNWLQVAWDALLALNHFAKASADGRANGDFRRWCQSEDSDEFPFPVGKVKIRESDGTADAPKFRRPRMLPVPKAVHRDGKVFMQAHLRIGGGNTVSPRLHFYDDGPNTGLVYVGYLGPHLRNSQT